MVNLVGYNTYRMRSISSLAQANNELSKYIPTMDGAEYTLENITKFMDLLGNPQDKLKVIHVAGTSGKTSTSYYIANLLHLAGYKTGLTVSPHIDEINERVQIDLLPLPENEYCSRLSEFLELVDSSELKLSHFEVMVAFAYWIFDKYKVDYGVVEVGLGGLLDGTNVVSRPDKVCVITDIGLDHTDILGDTLPQIAFQKAGIVHNSNVVYMNQQDEEIMDVVQEVCRSKGAKLNVIKTDRNSYKELPDFQQRNFSLAKTCADYILSRDKHPALTKKQIELAVQTYIPGRMEAVQYKGKTLVLDGSHSKQKVTALVSAMRQQFPGQEMTLLVSFGQNKLSSVIDSIGLLRQLGSSIIVTAYSGGQDEKRVPIDPKLLATYAKDAGFKTITIEPDPQKALNLLVKADDIVCVLTGSLYLLNDIHHVVVATR